MQRVFVTGANGFIGQALCHRMLANGWHVRGGIRSLSNKKSLPPKVEAVETGSIGAESKWDLALNGIDTVVHLAARVHVHNNTASEPDTAYREVNYAGTKNLAHSAAEKKIRRFIFMSSIKVNGEGQDLSYTEKDNPDPMDSYAVSKYEAEQALCDIGAKTGLEVVIIRPPLVYGPGVKANFLHLMKIVSCGIPLPFAGIKNRRSLISVGNLVDAVVTSIVHSQAVGKTFLVSDREDVSTPELIKRIATALDKPVRLFYLPPNLLRLLAKLAGKAAAGKKLLDSYSVDSSKIRSELGWTPPFSMQDGLAETAKWYLKKLG